MTTALNEELIDAVYRAALDPSAWADVTQSLRVAFPSTAQSFYFLHREDRRIQPVCLFGIEPCWVRSFDKLYFAADNPWMWVTRGLHRPGVVRTTERLESYLRKKDVLFRSAYYNEWMRPQRFKHNIGNTVLVEGGIVANVTLFRPPDMPTFDTHEVSAFEALSRHMTRALRMSIQLDRGAGPVSTASLDAMSDPAALIDARRRIVYANAAMERLLAAGNCLRAHHAQLVAADATVHQRLAAYLAAVAEHSVAGPDGCEEVLLAAGELSLRAIAVRTPLRRYLPAKGALLLLVCRACAPRSPVPDAAIVSRYGCTRREARLAQLLAEGRNLKQAAEKMGITYGTARGYLKIVFQKTGASTQAKLVRTLLGS